MTGRPGASVVRGGLWSRSLFGSRCPACGAPALGELCAPCAASLAGGKERFVVNPPAGVVAAVGYEGVARDLVTGLKYRNQRRAAGLLARLLAERLGPVRVDVVTWAPTGSARRQRRGFDQAELVARCLSRELKVPCRRLLHRRHGAAQTGRSRRERLFGPVFVARPSRRPRRVLLVDDVVTTGATLHAAAHALRLAGADHVVLAAVAATPGSAPTRPIASLPAWESSIASFVPAKARS